MRMLACARLRGDRGFRRHRALRAARPEAGASSHREAPLIADDPTADNTDLYAFRSPDKPDTVTIISNVIPGEDPAAGPNYYRFSADRPLQHPHRPERRRQAGRHLPLPVPQPRRAVLPRQHGAGLHGDADRPAAARRSSRAGRRRRTTSARGRRRTTATLVREGSAATTAAAWCSPASARTRSSADIGAIFDLLSSPQGHRERKGGGKDFFAGYAVHALALQIPIAQLDDADHTIGVWTTVDRQPRRRACAAG